MFRKLVNRRTIAAVSGSTVVAASGGYYYLNSGPTYQPSTKETRRPPPPWTPPSREQMLEALRSSAKDPDQEFDLLVVGGGATGAGVAVDAASRGLKVALVERDDFSAGEFHEPMFCERALPMRHAWGNLGEGSVVASAPKGFMYVTRFDQYRYRWLVVAIVKEVVRYKRLKPMGCTSISDPRACEPKEHSSEVNTFGSSSTYLSSV